MVEQKTVKLRKIKGTDNPSDALTKSVPGTLLDKHRPHLLGSEIPPSSLVLLAQVLDQAWHVPFKRAMGVVAPAA